ncbi:hypothetical protein [Nitrosophilus labii]|uniref:hypothetical protein n=1 Tax=Nitrosophilus labii TaxID=2706014 RepID=UPI001656B24F|nr:hypothetical protein [Nitrosophilus labii]
MLVVIPVDLNDMEEGKITSIADANYFVFLKLADGAKVKNSEFKKSFSNEIFDYIVVNDRNEDLEEVFELGARALLARKNMYIEDILEAIMFAELDELA